MNSFNREPTHSDSFHEISPEKDPESKNNEAHELNTLRQALSRSEERLREAQRLARIGHWSWSADRERVEWSEEMFRIYDVDPSGFEPTYESQLSFVPESDRPEYDALVARILERGNKFEFEHRLITPAGVMKTVWVRGEVKLGHDGRRLEIWGTTQDITERKLAEQRLSFAVRDLEKKNLQTEAMLDSARALLDHPAFEESARKIFDCCKNVTGATAGYVALLNEDGDENELLFLEAGGRPCSVDPELPMPIRGLRAEAYKSRLPAMDNQFNDSKWMEFMPQGHVRLDNVLFAPLVIEGKAVGLIGLANKPTDFSEADAILAGRFAEFAAIGLRHNQALDALRDREMKYRGLVENAAIGIISVSRDGKILEVNEKLLDILGSPSAEATKSVNLFNHPPLEEAGITDFIKECFETGKDSKAEIPYTSKWGKSAWLRMALKPMRDKDSVVCGCQAVVEDITKEKELEEQLRESQKMEAIGTLAGGVAHDFNNLLQIVGGHAELLLVEAQENGTEIEGPLAIKQASDRGAELVKNILTFSRKVNVQFTSVDLNEIVKSSADLLYRTIPRMINIELNLFDDLNPIEANPNQLEQIILNLAVNAKDAMPKGGTLTFHTSNVDLDESFCLTRIGLEPGAYTLLTVSDNGVGIEENNIKHVFEPFFSTKPSGEGTGLGLSTVFGIVRMHSGWVDIYSAPNAGATVHIYFPVSDKEPLQSSAHSRTSPSGGSETILVVDDESPIRNLVKSILTRAGYEVILASDAEEALSIYSEKSSSIDLVVLDLIMPGMGGTTCLDILRAMDPGIKALISSGYGVHENKAKLLEEHNVKTVSKPFDIFHFLSVVREVLDET
jgi:PAS domain S-box-containing protein